MLLVVVLMVGLVVGRPAGWAGGGKASGLGWWREGQQVGLVAGRPAGWAGGGKARDFCLMCLSAELPTLNFMVEVLNLNAAVSKAHIISEGGG